MLAPQQLPQSKLGESRKLWNLICWLVQYTLWPRVHVNTIYHLPVAVLDAKVFPRNEPAVEVVKAAENEGKPVCSRRAKRPSPALPRRPPPLVAYSEAVWYVLDPLRSPRAAQAPFDAADKPSAKLRPSSETGPPCGWLRCWWWMPWRCCGIAAGVGAW